jgi:hypothetical protein
MAKFRFAEGLKVYPVVVPADKTSATVESTFVKLDTTNWLTFLVNIGTTTGSASSDTLTFTVMASTSSTTNTSEVGVPFNYRLSAAVGTDLMGDITHVAAAGYEVLQTACDNMVVVIDVDPAEVQATLSGALFAQLVVTPSGSAANNLGVIAITEPRYPGNSITSASS